MKKQSQTINFSILKPKGNNMALKNKARAMNKRSISIKLQHCVKQMFFLGINELKTLYICLIPCKIIGIYIKIQQRHKKCNILQLILYYMLKGGQLK